MNLHKSLILLGTLGLVTLGSVGISPALADHPNNYRNQRQETRYRNETRHRQDNNQRHENSHRHETRREREYRRQQELRRERQY